MRKLAVLLVALLALFGIATPSQASVTSTVTIHYQKAFGNTDNWNLWLWEPNQNGFNVDFTSQDTYGKIATYTFDHAVTNVGFIVKVGAFERKDIVQDRSITNFAGGNAEVWLKGGVSTVFTTNPDLYTAAPVLPTWARSATLYEVNVRQFSSAAQGQKFDAIRKQLPRLKTLGVKLLWLMPIYPISDLGHKGSLGSPYAVANYQEVNPEFGSLASFKALVNAAHTQGFHVVLDWVANHTGLDNVWTANTSWYQTVVNGQIQPNADWNDVADLNYDNQDMRTAMINAMKYWVNTTGIDGFRCDFAGGVPTEFWNQAAAQLQTIKPLFMLAENDSEYSELQHAFIANYGWNLQTALNRFAQNPGDAWDFTGAIDHISTDYPAGTFPVTFITNHDENSWNGTEYERYGAFVKRFSALYFTLPGMPLIYNGQEIGLKRRLAFFDSDPIVWKSSPMTDFYRKLVALKTANRALWNGDAGGAVTQFYGNNNSILTFTRILGSSKVVVAINLTGTTQSDRVTLDGVSGKYYTYSNGARVTLTNRPTFKLAGGAFEIYSTTLVR